MMTRNVNLWCVLRRTVKKLKVLICGQWSHQWICSYPNQQYHTSIQDCVVTRTVNLQDVSRKSVQWDQYVMTRTVNLLNICVMTRNVMCNLNQKELIFLPICDQCLRLLATIMGQPEVTRNIYSTSKCCYLPRVQRCVQITETFRSNLTKVKTSQVSPVKKSQVHSSKCSKRDTKTHAWNSYVFILYMYGCISINNMILQCIYRTMK